MPQKQPQISVLRLHQWLKWLHPHLWFHKHCLDSHFYVPCEKCCCSRLPEDTNRSESLLKRICSSISHPSLVHQQVSYSNSTLFWKHSSHQQHEPRILIILNALTKWVFSLQDNWKSNMSLTNDTCCSGFDKRTVLKIITNC